MNPATRAMRLVAVLAVVIGAALTAGALDTTSYLVPAAHTVTR